MAFLNGYSKRKEVVISDANVDGNLTDFPLLVTFNADEEIGSDVDAGGLNIRFTEDDGETLLSYERQSFILDEGSASGEFWVKTPSILGAGGATIYVYYKSDSPSDGEDASNVWDANFIGVWHMEQDPSGSTTDSTSGAHHLTSTGTMISGDLVTGIVGQGVEFDGTDDGMTNASADFDFSNSITLEAWGRVQETIEDESIYHKWSGGNGYTLQTNGPLFLAIGSSGATSLATTTTVLSPDTDYYMVGTFDDVANSMQCYVDGLPDGSATSKNSLQNSGNDLQIARRSDTSTPEDGTWTQCRLDELRISNTARSAAWIKFTYHNISDGETTFGNEEVDSINEVGAGGSTCGGVSYLFVIGYEAGQGGVVCSQLVSSAQFYNVTASGGVGVGGDSIEPLPTDTVDLEEVGEGYNCKRTTGRSVVHSLYVSRQRGSGLRVCRDRYSAVVAGITVCQRYLDKLPRSV